MRRERDRRGTVGVFSRSRLLAALVDIGQADAEPADAGPASTCGAVGQKRAQCWSRGRRCRDRSVSPRGSARNLVVAASTVRSTIVSRRASTDRRCGRTAAESGRLSDWISVLLRQGPQLLQREPSAAPCRGYEDAGPHPLRARRLTRILSALPASWTCAAQLLGARPCAHRRQPTGRRDL